MVSEAYKDLLRVGPDPAGTVAYQAAVRNRLFNAA